MPIIILDILAEVGFVFISKVEICGVNTAKLPVLSAARKKELFEKIKKGDEKARQEFINGNLRLVLSIIQRFSNRGENADDLFQVGCVGLIKSIDNFDTEHGVQFSTYAVPMIIGEIKRYLRDNNSIRVSRSLRDTALKALRAREQLTNDMNREPTVDEIAKEIEMKKEEVVYALDAIQEPISLFEPIYNDNGDTVFVMDQVKDTSCTTESWLDKIALNDAILTLNDREKDIINKRFYVGKTQIEVAEEIGISQAQVSRLEKGALKKIRNRLY